MTRHHGQRRSGAPTRCTPRRRLTGSWRTPLKQISRIRTPNTRIRPTLSATSRNRGRIRASSAQAGCRVARPLLRAGILRHPVVGEVFRGGATTPLEPLPTHISLAQAVTQGAAPDTGANGLEAASTAADLGVGGGGASSNYRSSLLSSFVISR
jgi:hypothetical protein